MIEPPSPIKCVFHTYFQELRDLFKKYKDRMESEGKKVRTGGGFGGTGFKFDEAEAQYTTEKKKYQKAAFGLQVNVIFYCQNSNLRHIAHRYPSYFKFEYIY